MTDINALLQPIPGDTPCGVDLVFSPEFDAIREAGFRNPEGWSPYEEAADFAQALLDTVAQWNDVPDWAGDERNVVLALARLAAGTPVTAIALDFGYQSPAAFSTMFKRVLGSPPTSYLHPAG